MDKITIYIRVGKTRHVFRVPPGISLEALIERYRDELGLSHISLNETRAAIVTPLNNSLDEIRVEDGSEIVIMSSSLGDDIEYKGSGD